MSPIWLLPLRLQRKLLNLALGRDNLLKHLAELLAQSNAALVLHGIGGSGKTFLATTVAHQQRARFPGGVFWLNLANPTDLPLEIAACGGPEGLDLPGFDALRACLERGWYG
jgi:hypothetical protein